MSLHKSGSTTALLLCVCWNYRHRAIRAEKPSRFGSRVYIPSYRQLYIPSQAFSQFRPVRSLEQRFFCMPNWSTWVFLVETLYLQDTQASSIQDANEDYIFVQTVFKAFELETKIIPALLCIFFNIIKLD